MLKCGPYAVSSNWANFLNKNNNNNSFDIRIWTQFIFEYFKSLFIWNLNFDCISLMCAIQFYSCFSLHFVHIWFHSDFILFLVPGKNSNVIMLKARKKNTAKHWSMYDLINYSQKIQYSFHLLCIRDERRFHDSIDSFD